MKTITVKEVMTYMPQIMKPTDTAREAAEYMQRIDFGMLAIGEVNNIVGVITDRDIAMKIIAEHRNPDRVMLKDIMTPYVYCCDEDDDIECAAELMHKHNIHRLVVTKNHKATGIVTMIELLRNTGDEQNGDEVLYELVTGHRHAATE